MFTKNNLFFNDYKWSAFVDHDNPKIIGGNDHKELNRTEGYEMLYFINSLVKTWDWKDVNISSYQNLEKVIKNEVPENVRTHTGIKNWIVNRFAGKEL